MVISAISASSSSLIAEMQTSAGCPGPSGRTGEVLEQVQRNHQRYLVKTYRSPKVRLQTMCARCKRETSALGSFPANVGSRSCPLELRVAGSVSQEWSVHQEGVGKVVPPEATFFPLWESELPASPLQGSLSCQPHPSHPPHSPTQLAYASLPTPSWGPCRDCLLSFPYGRAPVTIRSLPSHSPGRLCHPAPDFRPRMLPTSSCLLLYIPVYSKPFFKHTLFFVSLPPVKEITGGRESQPTIL